MIQPAGLGGSPAVGHFWTATVNASWMASSARSMSPRRRTRLATARPYSSRNIGPICATSAVMRGSALGVVLERTYLDRGGARLAGPRGQRQRGVQVGRLEDPEAAELLLRLRVR